MVEGFNMTLGVYVKRLFHGASVDKDRHIAIEDIDLLTGIGYHASCRPYTTKTDDYAAYKEQAADDKHELYLILKVLYYHN